MISLGFAISVGSADRVMVIVGIDNMIVFPGTWRRNKKDMRKQRRNVWNEQGVSKPGVRGLMPNSIFHEVARE